MTPAWVQSDVAKALDELIWAWQDESTRPLVADACTALRKLLPEPTSFRVVANACGTRRVVEAKTFGEAHVVADGLNEADWDHICIQAEAGNLRWTTTVIK